MTVYLALLRFEVVRRNILEWIRTFQYKNQKPSPFTYLKTGTNSERKLKWNEFQILTLAIFSHSKLLNDKFEVFSTLSSMHYAVQIKLQTLEQEVKFIDTTYFSCETTYIHRKMSD